jgi:hypothetical protein
VSPAPGFGTCGSIGHSVSDGLVPLVFARGRVAADEHLALPAVANRKPWLAIIMDRHLAATENPDAYLPRRARLFSRPLLRPAIAAATSVSRHRNARPIRTGLIGHVPLLNLLRMVFGEIFNRLARS